MAFGKLGARGGFGSLGGLGTASGPVVSSAAGQVFSAGGRTILKFTANDTLIASKPFYADILVIASGGGATTGGGGAGQVVYQQNVLVGTSTAIVVGQEAAGAGASATATAGSNSSFGSVVAQGGAPAGPINANAPTTATGSGAGAGSTSTTQPFNGGPGGGLTNENVGGNVTTIASPFAAAGGGGAGTVGSNATATGIAGDGGDGIQNSITGAALWYAGGGAGTNFTGSGTPGKGGKGGGGKGVLGTGGPGEPQTGGGGGGGTNSGVGGTFSGSGVVIISLRGTVSTQAAYTLPISASLAAFYSVIKLAGWGGSCIQVQRSSDNATQDIGFVNNVVDKAAADTFANGSTLTVTKIYDQSGNGKDLTCTGGPTFSSLNEQNGIRPVSFCGVPSSVSQFAQNAALSLNSNALTAYMVATPRTSYDLNNWFEFADATFTTSYVAMRTRNTSLATIYTGTTFSTGIFPRAHLGCVSASYSGTTGSIVRVNGVPVLNAANATSNTIGGLQIGQDIAGDTSINDLFVLAVYGATHTRAQMATTEALLISACAPNRNFTNKVIQGGSSLITSYHATNNQTAPWAGGFGTGAGSKSSWETITMASAGRSLAIEASNVSTYVALYDRSKTKNVVILDAPSNDIAAATYADASAATTGANNLYNSTLLPMIVTLKAAGFAVVVPTIIARNPWDTSTNFRETARLQYNSNVVSGAVANGYTAADRASLAIFNSTAATADTTYYYTDRVHLVNAGYAAMEAIDAAAILAA